MSGGSIRAIWAERWQAGGCAGAFLLIGAGPASGASLDWSFQDKISADLIIIVMAALALLVLVAATIITHLSRARI